jgi:FMN phosphatase YigB (HAD superfamily)
VEANLSKTSVVYLFDVDNTLLDNDRVTQDLKKFLTKELSEDRERHYWQIFETLRAELGYADYLGALQRYRAEYPRDSHILAASIFLINYPFANRLFPNSLDVVDKAKEHGRPVILSDGDAVFQPRKIERSGLLDAFESNILIYVHKEQELDDVEHRYPADHYVLIDDKVRILDAVKQIWGKRVITVWPRQGHYAMNVEECGKYMKPDVTIERIGDFANLTL